MMPCRFHSFPLFVCIVYMTISRLSAENNEDFTSNAQFLETLKNSHHDLSAIKDTLTGLDKDLGEYQKRSCRFGLNNRQCALSNLDRLMSATDWLSSGHSPGKRSVPSVDPAFTDRLNKILENIARRRDHLRALTAMIQQASGQSEPRKRTCMFNLGGRCATELASAIADQYYYLNGPSSPGKRRKRDLPFVAARSQSDSSNTETQIAL